MSMNKFVRLIPFDEADCGPVEQFEVDVALSNDGLLWLHYIVDAPPESVVLPIEVEPARTDELWKSTCFEVFVKAQGSAEYLEFNFAPSRLWAAYHFSDARQGMSELPLEAAPEVYVTGGEAWFTVETSVTLPSEWRGKPLTANITAVIEAIDGTKSYWALQHASEAPDFHDPDCFVHLLEAGNKP
jgi:hypothetical protein